jgi:hypothetical protein
MFKKIINLYVFYKKSKNIKRYFENNLKSKKYSSNSIILIEFNAFFGSHGFFSLMSYKLTEKYSSNLIAFQNYKLSGMSFKESLFDKIKWIIGKKLGINLFGIYKSFGVKNFIKPYFQKKNKKFIENSYQDILNKIQTKIDILKISVDEIPIGDLIYDGYLKLYGKSTLQIDSDDFKNYLYDFLTIFYFWKDYLNKNDVKCVVGVHARYAYGIIHRLAVYNNIKSLIIIEGKLYNLNKDIMHETSEYKLFKKIFSSFSESQKYRYKKIATKYLNNRFSGKLGNEVKELVLNKSAYSNEFDINNKILNNNKKIKILIATHSLGDASSFWGPGFFPDFYEWLIFLVNISKKTEYDWYIKDHPYTSDLKLAKSLDRTIQLSKDILKQGKNFNYIDSNTTHNQIISEKIDFVLTVYGTVAMEYAYHNIPVIMATKNCPTSPYNFNIHPENISDYENKLMNLKDQKIKINKEEVLEYFFMRYIFFDYDVFFENFSSFFDNKENNWDDVDTLNFLDFWSEKVDKKTINNMIKKFDKFLDSNDYSMNIMYNKIL